MTVRSAVVRGAQHRYRSPWRGVGGQDSAHRSIDRVHVRGLQTSEGPAETSEGPADCLGRVTARRALRAPQAVTFPKS